MPQQKQKRRSNKPKKDNFPKRDRSKRHQLNDESVSEPDPAPAEPAHSTRTGKKKSTLQRAEEGGDGRNARRAVKRVEEVNAVSSNVVDILKYVDSVREAKNPEGKAPPSPKKRERTLGEEHEAANKDRERLNRVVAKKLNSQCKLCGGKACTDAHICGASTLVDGNVFDRTWQWTTKTPQPSSTLRRFFGSAAADPIGTLSRFFTSCYQSVSVGRLAPFHEEFGVEEHHIMRTRTLDKRDPDPASLNDVMSSFRHYPPTQEPVILVKDMTVGHDTTALQPNQRAVAISTLNVTTGLLSVGVGLSGQLAVPEAELKDRDPTAYASSKITTNDTYQSDIIDATTKALENMVKSTNLKGGPLQRTVSSTATTTCLPIPGTWGGNSKSLFRGVIGTQRLTFRPQCQEPMEPIVLTQPNPSPILKLDTDYFTDLRAESCVRSRRSRKRGKRRSLISQDSSSEDTVQFLSEDQCHSMSGSLSPLILSENDSFSGLDL
jgi:hypothetical protein